MIPGLPPLSRTPGMEGALMSISPDHGKVICMVGGRDFQKSQFNRCTQAVRQPGSSFKPKNQCGGARQRLHRGLRPDRFADIL